MANLSVDDFIEIAKQKGVDTTQHEQTLRQKFGTTGVPVDNFPGMQQATQQPVAQVPQQPAPTAPVQGKPQTQGLIPDLLNKINPALAVSVGQFARGAQANYGTQPTNPSQENDYQKLYNQEAIKKQFEDPNEAKLRGIKVKAAEAGLTVDENGNVVKTSDIASGEKNKRLVDFESRRQASQLRGELNQNQYIKNFQAMNSAASGIDSILEDTLSRPDLKSKNVGDQALITLYNKILDPMSVVRESEYARTPEGQALMNRIAGFIQKVQAGGSGLTDSDRVEIARAAKVLINNSGELYNSKISDYEGLANSYGIEDPSLVVGGYQKFSPMDINKQYQIGQAPQPNQQSGQPSVLTPDQQAKRARLQQKYGV